MNTFLQLQCGDYALLMPVATILEIGTNDASRDQSARRPWREGSLPVVDLPGLLGCGMGPRGGQVVIGAAAEPRAIAIVDAVCGIREFSDADLIDIGVMGRELSSCIAGVFPDGRGACLLRLREPYDWLGDNPALHTQERST